LLRVEQARETNAPFGRTREGPAPLASVVKSTATGGWDAVLDSPIDVRRQLHNHSAEHLEHQQQRHAKGISASAARYAAQGVMLRAARSVAGLFVFAPLL
jgi:hypothetical protein